MNGRVLHEDAYAPRPTRLHRVIRAQGWTVKLYGISHGRPAVEDGMLDAAAEAGLAHLPAAAEPGVFDIGFVIAHQGQDAEWVLVHWWQTGGVLARRLLVRPCGAVHAFTTAPDHLLACVWELPVLAFERDAWVRFVLADPSEPDLDGYLEAAPAVHPWPGGTTSGT